MVHGMSQPTHSHNSYEFDFSHTVESVCNIDTFYQPIVFWTSDYQGPSLAYVQGLLWDLVDYVGVLIFSCRH